MPDPAGGMPSAQVPVQTWDTVNGIIRQMVGGESKQWSPVGPRTKWAGVRVDPPRHQTGLSTFPLRVNHRRALVLFETRVHGARQ